jgi:hypothetical protein
MDDDILARCGVGFGTGKGGPTTNWVSLLHICARNEGEGLGRNRAASRPLPAGAGTLADSVDS